MISPLPWPQAWQKQKKSTTVFCVTLIFVVIILSSWHYTYTTHFFTPSRAQKPPLIPRKIWQIWFPQRGAAEHYVSLHKDLRETATWIGMNTGYQYRLVGRDWGDEFVKEKFAHDQNLVDTYLALQNHGVKSDLLRYLLLYTEGGVYTDIDTIAFQPIDLWVSHLRHAAKVIVGIEYDRRDGGGWVDVHDDLQFCQWTIAATPGHPLLKAMIKRALISLHSLAENNKSSIAELMPTPWDTMNSTGPAAWTDVVFEQIQRARPDITKLTDLSSITKSYPRLYGDILVLGIDGFGMGQPHSASTNDGSIPDAAFLKHLFRGSWRQN